MNVEQVLDTLRVALDLPDLEGRPVPIDETVVSLPPEHLRAAVQTLVDRLGITHLSTITGQGDSAQIELLYHFWEGQGLTLRVALDPAAPRAPSLTGLVPGASFYEREAAEMLGVTFEGIPPAGPFVLPDDWDGPPPLRRSADDG